MSDDETAAETHLKAPVAAKPRALSRSAAKRYFNLHKSTADSLTDGKSRALIETSEELQRVRQKLSDAEGQLAMAAALLEATVRRHDTQVFDRRVVQKDCARGDVAIEMTADRITIKLRTRPRAIET